MKILVPVKKVVDFSVKVRANLQQTDVDIEHVKKGLNPFDEIAIEQAVRFKEQGLIKEVVVVTCGPSPQQDVLRTALAMGADRAILLQTDITLQQLAVAKLLAYICKQEQPQLVIAGKQAIDIDAGQTGPMLAMLLDWPQATCACKIELTDCIAKVVQEVDGGLQSVQLDLPAVITTDLRLNEPRFVSLPNLMRAKRQPITIINADELGIDIQPKLQITKVYEPQPRKAGEIVNSVAELLDKLKNQAKVL